MKPKQEIWQWHSLSSNLSWWARSNIHYYIARGLPIWFLSSSSVRMIKMDQNSKLSSAPVQLMHSDAGCNLGLPQRFVANLHWSKLEFTLQQPFLVFGQAEDMVVRGAGEVRLVSVSLPAHLKHMWCRTFLCKNKHLSTQALSDGFPALWGGGGVQKLETHNMRM